MEIIGVFLVVFGLLFLADEDEEVAGFIKNVFGLFLAAAMFIVSRIF